MKKINLKPMILIIAALAIIMSCFIISALANENDANDAMIEINANEKLNASLIKKMRLENDGYIGIPVELSIYYDYETHGKATPIGYLDPDGDAVVLYVVNANVERIGTKSDVEIISGLLDRGYVVAVANYFNNSKSNTPNIDWSAQGIREALYKGTYFSDITDKVGAGTYVTNFILPAGYDLIAFSEFWEIDKHGADGSLEKIVENWNTDFRSSQNRDKIIYWCDENGNRKATWDAPDGSSPVWLNADGSSNVNGQYIKVKYTKAETIGDCVNPDGTPLDLSLYAHVIYPTNPETSVPVMNLASCGLFLSSAPTSEDEYCDFTGFLFNGYAGMIYDYLWYPMARQYGYYDGNASNGAVTGDHMNYSLHIWNDKLVNTAAMRFIRHLAVDESETFKFDTEHMGVIGLSKGSWFDFLGEAVLRDYTVANPDDYTTEELMELIDLRYASYTPKRYLEGHHGETRYQSGNTDTYIDGNYTIDGGELQPWLLYESTGKEILAYTSYNYTACGTNQEDITAGHVPMFNHHSLNDSFGNAYSTVGPLVSCMDIPTVDFVCDIYHAMAYGPDEHYGIDTYVAQFNFANYFLKETPISVMYVDPVANTTGLKVNEDIVVVFAGVVTADEIVKVAIKDSNGNAVLGEWTSTRGGTTWTFKHDTLKGGEIYTLTVPASIKGDNGKEMGEAYVAQYKTVNENAIYGTLENNYITVSIPETITSGVKLGFSVDSDAYNTAEIYLVNDMGATSGELIGTVNVSGKGVYEIDITDKAVKNLGKSLTFLIKAKREVSEAYTYSGMDYSYGNRIGRENVILDGNTVSKIFVGNNGGYNVPGYDKNVNVFYSNLTTVFTNNKILGTSKITEADLGRKFTITVKVLDSVSRVVMLSLNDTNNKDNLTIDLNAQRYNYQTVAGEWTEFTFDYIVYEPSYGDTVGSHVKVLTVSASPTGDTHMPMWFAETTVTEVLTDLTVSDAYLSVYDDGYTYKADSADGAFRVGETYYSTFAAALSAAGNGGTVTLMQNCIVDNVANAFEIGTATNVTVDLNGYSVRAKGASPVNIAAKNAAALVATFKNGTVYLYNNAFIGYASQTGAASGKDITVNFENVTVSNVDNSRLYGFMTEPKLTVDTKVNVHVNLNDCDINVDAYSNINVNFEIFGVGTNNLFVDYSVKGGSVTVDSFARAYLTKSTDDVVYIPNENGEYTKLILSVGTPAPAKRLGVYNELYGEFRLAETDGLVAIYTIYNADTATKYGVIPEEYADVEKYPFVVFSNTGKFVGAYSFLFGQENGPFTRSKSLNSQYNVWDEVNETYGTRPYASYILMRRDYEIGDAEYDWNFAQSQGTTILDLNGFTLYKNATSSSKTKVVFPGTAKANPGSGDAYTYPSYFVIQNGTINTNAPLLSLNTYGTTYDLTKKVMDFTFDNVAIVAAEGTNAAHFLHQIDNASNGTKGPATINVTYNDCTIDIRGYGVPTSATTLFNANGTSATMLNINVAVNGGVIKAKDFKNVSLITLDNYYGSSITFDKGENETYTAIDIASTATVSPSGTVTTPEGGKVYSKKASTDGVDTYLLSGKITEYGAVPDEYINGTEYPFLVFANGDFKGAYKYWADKDSTVNSAIERAHELANGASGVGVKVTILLQNDYANVRSSDNDSSNHKFGQITGELTIDLNGHTLTSGTWMLFSFNGQLVGGKLYDQKVTVKNGTLLAGNKVIYAVEQYNTAWTEASHGRKLIDVTFQNVTFGQSLNYSTEKVPFLENTSTSQMSPIDFKALYDNCVFDYDNHASGTAFTMLNFSVASGVKADITIKGGYVELSTFQNFNLYKLSTGDSVKFAKNDEGEYMIAKIAESGASTTADFTADNGKTFNFAHWDTKDGRKLYKLISLVTEYGTIPATNASLVDYPFAVFVNGEFKGAYKYWADKDSTVNSALERAYELANGASGVGVKVTILLRTDYANTRSSDNDSATQKFGQFTGELTVDLGGNTLTAGTWMLFSFNGQLVGGKLYDQKVTVKNGTLLAGNKVIYAVEQYGTAWTEESHGRKLIDVTFQNVTFGQSPSYSIEKVPFLDNTSTTKMSPIDFKVLYEDCVFNYDNHKSGTGFTMFDFSVTSGVKADVTIKGGCIKVPTFQNFNIYKISAGDSFKFAKNDAGEYISAIVSNGGDITTADYKTNDDKNYNFGLITDTTTVDTYVLMDLNTSYGKIPYQYANPETYPFIIFDKTGFRYAEKVFYGTQSGASAIGRARSIMVTSNAWDAVNKTYGDDANYAIILMRRDYTHDSTEYYNNLAQIQGTITIDLGGYTMIASDNKYMFEATIKRWPSADSGDVAEVFPTTVIVKNGTLVSVNRSLLKFDTASSGTINLLDKTFTWQFDNITFKNTGTAENPFITCAYRTGLVKIPTPVIYNNCTFDLSNIQSIKSVFNIDTDHDVLLHITVNGGKIIAPANITHLDILRKVDTNGSTIIFTKGEDGYIQLITTSEYTNSEGLNTSSGDASFVKVGYQGGKNVYSLVPTALTSYTPKMSLTLDRNLTMNVYIPVNGTQKFVFDGVTYENLAVLADDIVTIDGKDYYLVKVELAASEAARNVPFSAVVIAEDKTATVRYTFSVPNYSVKVLSDGTEIEKTLVKDILSYVRAAYVYFGNNDDLEAIAKINNILGDNYDENNLPIMNGSAIEPTEGLTAATFVLSSTPAIRFYLPEGADASAYKFYAKDVALNTEFGENEKGKYFDIDVYAYRICDTITYKINGIEAGSYHIRSYYEWAKTQGNDALVKLVSRFAKYAESAKAYRAEVLSALGCEHNYVEGECTNCGSIDPSSVPAEKDYGTMQILAPVEIYSNYDGKNISVVFSDPTYTGDVSYTTNNANVYVENGRIYAKGTFNTVTEVTVTATTAHHVATATVKVSTYQGDISVETKVQYYEEYIIKEENNGGMIFVGDSYVDGYKIESIPFWKDFYEDFAGEKAFLMGLSGAKINDLEIASERIVYPMEPSEIVVHIGHNDMHHSTITVEEFVERLTTLLKEYHEKLPNAKIYYFSVDPKRGAADLGSSYYESSFVKVPALNAAMSAFAENNDWLVYVDTTSIFYSADGTINKNMFPSNDVSHPTLLAYDLMRFKLNEQRGKNEAYNVERYGMDTGVNIHYFTDANGNPLIDNYAISGKTIITQINKNNAHFQFRFSANYRFVLWDENNDGKFGAGYIGGGTVSDKTSGVTVYDANDGLAFNWTVIVMDGKAYWYVNGKLMQKFDNPTLEFFTLGGLQLDAVVYDVELSVKSENEAAFNEHIAPYADDVINIEMNWLGGDVLSTGKMFTDASGNALKDNYVISGKVDITNFCKDSPFIQFRFAPGCRFLLWDTNKDGKFAAGYTENGNHVSDTTAGANLTVFDANGGITLEWAVVVKDGKAYWYINGKLEKIFENPNLQGFHIGAVQMDAFVYDIKLYVEYENVDAYNAAVSEYLG